MTTYDRMKPQQTSATDDRRNHPAATGPAPSLCRTIRNLANACVVLGQHPWLPLVLHEELDALRHGGLLELAQLFFCV